MSPQEPKSVADCLIGDPDHEIQTKMRVLAAVPADKLAYQPDPEARIGLGLVRHVAL